MISTDRVPHMLSDTYREERKAFATFLLHWYSARGKGFMLQIVTGWNLVPQFSTVTGLANVTPPRKTQFKSVLLSGKIMAAVFWVEKGFSCELLPWGTVVNSESYIESLRSLNACLHWVCPARKMSEVFLFHDNAWLPKIVCTPETIMKVLSVVLAHPLYTLTSHYHIFICLIPCKKPMKTRYCVWWGTAECHIPATAMEEDKLLWGMNTDPF
jgi:hypothetical protein